MLQGKIKNDDPHIILPAGTTGLSWVGHAKQSEEPCSSLYESSNSCEAKAGDQCQVLLGRGKGLTCTRVKIPEQIMA